MGSWIKEETKDKLRIKLLENHRIVFGVWMLMAFVSGAIKFKKCNNYLIFRGVYHHTIEQLPLYTEYPSEYFDTNHYGILFSLIIAPFAILPVWLGLILWHMALALFLYYAIQRLPINNYKKGFILWFTAHELLTGLFMSQFNIAIAAIIILSAVYINKQKEVHAAFHIMLGTFVKLYGIVGLAFFFFSKHKTKFILSLLGWAVIMFALPMIISSPEYVVNQYQQWYESLVGKNASNMFSVAQNISVLGLVRKATQSPNYSDLLILIPGMIVFLLPYLRIKKYNNTNFRLDVLASTLLFVVLFSTGSESSTYIVALIGVALWYVNGEKERTHTDIALMWFAFIVTSMSPSDLFPAYIRREIIQPYALKALPCAIIWLKLIYEMCTKRYEDAQNKQYIN